MTSYIPEDFYANFRRTVLNAARAILSPGGEVFVQRHSDSPELAGRYSPRAGQMPSQRSAKPEKKTVALLGIADHETEALRFLPIGLYGVWNCRGTVGKNK